MDMILGCSVTTVEQAVTAETDGVDYIAVGSMYPQPLKETAKVMKTTLLNHMAKKL